MATLDDVSLAGIAIGTHAGAIGASFAGDDEFPATSGSGPLTVIDVPTPGLMFGDGFVHADNRYAFNFLVSETANGDDRGSLSLRVTETTPKPKGKPRDDRFIARTYTSVRFGDADTVLFAGLKRPNPCLPVNSLDPGNSPGISPILTAKTRE